VVLVGRFLPVPELRGGFVWLASERVARDLIWENLKHARIGCPGSQDVGRVVAPSRAQLQQQRADARRVAETNLSGRVACQQGPNRQTASHLAQRLQQPGGPARVTETGLPGRVTPSKISTALARYPQSYRPQPRGVPSARGDIPGVAESGPACSRRGDVEIADEGIVLKIPQHDHGDGLVDSADRVVIGAAFLRDLVEAGL
jgi:hypothetical protein